MCGRQIATLYISAERTKLMKKLRIVNCDDKLMTGQTKQVIRCIDKRCRGIKAALYNVEADNDDAHNWVKAVAAVNEGKADAAVVNLRDYYAYLCEKGNEALWSNVVINSLIKDVDNRCVLITKRKKGKHFSNALIAVRDNNSGRQLKEMFDGVNYIKTEDDVKELAERLLADKYDGILVSAADVIHIKLHRMVSLRYKYFDSNIIIPPLGEGITALLCRKDLDFAPMLKTASNKRIMRELTVEKFVIKTLKSKMSENCGLSSNSSDLDISVKAYINKADLDIRIYVYNDGAGRYFDKTCSYSDRKKSVLELVCEVQKYIKKSNVF